MFDIFIKNKENIEENVRIKAKRCHKSTNIAEKVTKLWRSISIRLMIKHAFSRHTVNSNISGVDIYYFHED